jgi:hypothetical protein
MKLKITKVCVTLGLVLLVGATQPKTQAMDISIGGFGSYVDLDSSGEAMGGGALMRFGLTDWFAIDARATYFDLNDMELDLIPLEATALLRLPLLEDRLVPYAGFGIGYYMFTDSDLVEVDNDVGYYPVVGVELHFGAEKQWAVFGEARWLFIFSDVDAATGSSFNSDDMSGVGFNLGLSLKF